MGIITGNQGSVYKGTDKVAELKEFDISVTVAELDSTRLDADWDGVEAGGKSASGSIIARYDPADVAAQAALVVGNKVELNFYPQGNGEGIKYFKAANALITNMSMGIKRNEFIEKNFTFKVDGALTEETVPVP